jgi:peroxiredoxin
LAAILFAAYFFREEPTMKCFPQLPFLSLPFVLSFFCFHATASNRLEKQMDPSKTEVFLKVAKLKEITEAIKSQQDKVVVVCCWASWNAPGIKKLQQVIELQKSMQNAKVTFISISIDELEDQQLATKILQKQNALFTHFLAERPKDLAAHWDSHALWCTTLVFDSNGKIAHKFEPGDSPSDMKQCIEKLLKK